MYLGFEPLIEQNKLDEHNQLRLWEILTGHFCICFQH